MSQPTKPALTLHQPPFGQTLVPLSEFAQLRPSVQSVVQMIVPSGYGQSEQIGLPQTSFLILTEFTW